MLKADNIGAFYLATNDARNLNDRTKHIDIRYYFIREKVQQGEVAIKIVLFKENLADVLTKPLAREAFKRMRELLGVHPPLSK